MFGLGGPEILGILVLVAITAGLVLAIVLLAARAAARGGRPESARAVLDRRYASGEITREQYVQMRSDLEEQVRD